MTEVRYTGLGHRRSHPKSRLGCANCKRRRIKCDESKPKCNNCIKHSVICSFSSSSQPSSQSTAHLPGSSSTIRWEGCTPSEVPTISQNTFPWGPMTAELMHNYVTTTCATFSDNPILEIFMRVNVPRIGFANVHVLHMILGLSALHLAKFNPTQEQSYMDQADRHYQAGLQTACLLLPKLNEENCHSLYLFSNLCTSFALARGPVPGDFLLFSDNGPAEWKTLVRGSQPVFDSFGDLIMNGPVAPMIKSGVQGALLSIVPLPEVENEQLARLRELIETTSTSPDESQVLNKGLDELFRLYSSRHVTEGRKTQAQLRSIGIWLYRASNDFTGLLQKRHPAALVLFAFSCVALHGLSSNWAMGPWVPHILSAIHERLPLEYLPWIQWPLQQIGWIPPMDSLTFILRRREMQASSND
ncbi:hypothetical protein K504DRAFT_395531 [Pleomassaria siparia CBS 279.74]|uniref:Zn(2)-C6 fungal-type domain-containing protein n=1 Tax=Pleomassaria siparia CBS 279.74 TaxID=1314801 RepID=A0A6G1KQZ9_9PLEO|nr:hypothetical protein K504DRAFT_395531 [Pleomassaria siparia CBS 279.74]